MNVGTPSSTLAIKHCVHSCTLCMIQDFAGPGFKLHAWKHYMLPTMAMCPGFKLHAWKQCMLPTMCQYAISLSAFIFPC